MDAADSAALAAFRQRLTDGEEQLVPASVVDRLLAGENRIRVWREHRGLTMGELARKASLGQGFLSQIETGRRDGAVDTLKRLASALSLTLDDVAG